MDVEVRDSKPKNDVVTSALNQEEEVSSKKGEPVPNVDQLSLYRNFRIQRRLLVVVLALASATWIFLLVPYATSIFKPRFQGTLSIATQEPRIGEEVNISATVKNTSFWAAKNLNVHVEGYNQAVKQVLKVVFKKQNFARNQSRTYCIPWTFKSTGLVRLTLGVWPADYSETYYWIEHGPTFNVLGHSEPRPDPTVH